MPSSSSIGPIRSPAASWPSGAASAVRQPEPRGADRRDRATARRAHQVAREALLAERRQPFESDKGHVHEGRDGHDHVDAHARTLSGCAAASQPTDRRIVDRLARRCPPRRQLGARAAERAVVRGRDRGVRIGRHRRHPFTARDLERRAAATPTRRARPRARASSRRARVRQVDEERRDVVEVEQRGAERLVALEQQIGDAARAGEARADGLRGGPAVQVDVVADRARSSSSSSCVGGVGAVVQERRRARRRAAWASFAPVALERAGRSRGARASARCSAGSEALRW